MNKTLSDHTYTLSLRRLARQTGIRQEEELEAPESLFQEVTEEEYADLIHTRQRDNFVLDDGMMTRSLAPPTSCF